MPVILVICIRELMENKLILRMASQMISYGSAEDTREKPFLLVGVDLLVDLVSLLLIALYSTNLEGPIVRLFGLLQLAQLSLRIAQPLIRNHLLFVERYRLLKALFGLLEFAQPVIRCSFIMVVYGVIWLEFDCLVMLDNRVLVLFQFVIGSSKVPMIRRDCRLEVDCFFSELGFLLEVSQFPDCFSFQIVKIAIFSKVQSSLAGRSQLLPHFEMQEGVCFEEIFFFGVVHSLRQIQDLFILTLRFQCFDLGAHLLIGFEHYRPSVFVIFEFDLHWEIFNQ